MIDLHRKQFNARFTPEKNARFQSLLTERCGMVVPFRNCETPCFFEKSLLEKMERYGRELILQLMDRPDYLRAAGETIPEEYRVPNENERPLFVQVDFGLDEQLEPKLVEIQGFPSLYAYQPTLAETYRDAYQLSDNLSPFLSGLDRSAYDRILRTAVLGDCDAENVVLLELHPETQKTLPDFLLTEKLCGIETVCVTSLKSEGGKLYREKGGRLVPIDRIYNRVIVDELLRKNIEIPVDLREPFDVEWAGHPNWYFKISKFSLPFLDHVCVPKTVLLSEVESLPDDLENYVLKPLFSFAGLGVKVGPTRADFDGISDRSEYILQPRVNFVPTIETPHGPTKVEIRIMFVWQGGAGTPEENLTPVTALLRMGRGKMMGVDHNRELEWVGASAAFTLGD